MVCISLNVIFMCAGTVLYRDIEDALNDVNIVNQNFEVVFNHT